MTNVAELSDLWEDDRLGRWRDAKTIQQFLLRRTEEKVTFGQQRTYVLNIDAPWGTGKSFFLERFYSQLERDGYLVARVNAWVDDHADDPLISVLSAIEDSLNAQAGLSKSAHDLLTKIVNNGADIAISLAKNSILSFAKRFFGDAVHEVTDILGRPNHPQLESAVTEALQNTTQDFLDSKANKLVSAFRDTTTKSRLFRSNLSKLIQYLGNKNEKHKQVFVLIDELDRCRPTYAIQMLERVKHLFETDGLVFILATDTSQLRHAICSVYGAGFDSHRYLFRFFDRQYRFREADKLLLLSRLRADRLDLSLVNVVHSDLKDRNNEFDRFFTSMADKFKLPIREFKTAFDMLADFVTTWRYKSPVELTYLLPLICISLRSGVETLDPLNTEEMERIARENLNWPATEVTSQNGNKYTIPAWQFFIALHGRRDSEISHVLARAEGENDFMPDWIKARFRDELNFIHGGVITTSKRQTSVLQEYMPHLSSISNFTE